jgi:hypothetical protein
VDACGRGVGKGKKVRFFVDVIHGRPLNANEDQLKLTSAHVLSHTNTSYFFLFYRICLCAITNKDDDNWVTAAGKKNFMHELHAWVKYLLTEIFEIQ